MVSNFYPGQVFLYNYLPKHAKDMKYYDYFPLVILLDARPGMVMGLNLHYLPHRERFLLLKNLYETLKGVKKVDKKTLLDINYEILQGMRTQYLSKPCLKKYLIPYIVGGKVIPIPLDDLPYISNIPLERFREGPSGRFYSKEEVWKDSLEQIR